MKIRNGKRKAKNIYITTSCRLLLYINQYETITLMIVKVAQLWCQSNVVFSSVGFNSNGFGGKRAFCLLVRYIQKDPGSSVPKIANYITHVQDSVLNTRIALVAIIFGATGIQIKLCQYSGSPTNYFEFRSSIQLFPFARTQYITYTNIYFL